MSAIKKGLRRSDKTKMTEPRPTLADRSRSVRFNKSLVASDQPYDRNVRQRTQPGTTERRRDSLPAFRKKDGFQAEHKPRSSASSAEYKPRSITYGTDESRKWKRDRDTGRGGSRSPMGDSFPKPSTLRLYTPGRQEQEPTYETTSSYKRVSQYDPAEAKKDRRQERVAQREAQDPSLSKDYVNIQRSSAASEFIYGRSSVLAALNLGRRRIYKLYVARNSEDERKGFEDLAKYALNRGIQVQWITNSKSQAEMDRIAKGRPHNGVILEASPLPRLPVCGLKPAHKGRPFEVELQRQSAEEEEVNGMNTIIPIEAPVPRYPFLIMLDEIVDQGNLGGILRSAYFLGADGVVLSSHMAALNAIALKAASGAAESIKLLSVHNTTGFLQSSKDNGWKVYAAVAPPANNASYKAKHVNLNQLGQPLQDAPCILLLGGEGDGLRRDLIGRADQTLSIAGIRQSSNGLDSLNVSVAAGILMEAFLRDSTGKSLDAQGSSALGTPKDGNLLF